MSTKKNFDPILSDYAFFEAHATEAENDLKAYLAAIRQSLGRKTSALNFLDFGGGTGSFTTLLLKKLNWPAAQLKLTLIEPGNMARIKAVAALQAFSTHSVQDYPALPDALNTSFDIILSNHVLYYVSDLDAMIHKFCALKAPDGLFMAALAGNQNILIQCWKYGFGLVGEEVPYHKAEDLEAVLIKRKERFTKQSIQYRLRFPDSTENCLKILRFLFSADLKRMPQEELLHFFDPFQKEGFIHADTYDVLFVVGNG